MRPTIRDECYGRKRSLNDPTRRFLSADVLFGRVKTLPFLSFDSARSSDSGIKAAAPPAPLQLVRILAIGVHSSHGVGGGVLITLPSQNSGLVFLGNGCVPAHSYQG